MYEKETLHRHIRQAVLTCMETTDIKDIRVQTLLSMTGISKATFYRNYRSVEAIVREMELEFISGLRAINDHFAGTRLHSPVLMRKNCQEITAYLYAHRDFLRIIKGVHGDPQFFYKHSRILLEQLASAGFSAGRRPHGELYLQLLVDGTNSVLDTWLAGRTDITPEEMAAVMDDMFRRVLL